MGGLKGAFPQANGPLSTLHGESFSSPLYGVKGATVGRPTRGFGGTKGWPAAKKLTRCWHRLTIYSHPGAGPNRQYVSISGLCGKKDFLTPHALKPKTLRSETIVLSNRSRTGEEGNVAEIEIQ